MQDKKISKYVLLSVPAELLEDAGIRENDVLQMYAENGRLIIGNADDTGGFVCDGDCEKCPMSETDCDVDCDNCPCFQNCEESEAW